MNSCNLSIGDRIRFDLRTPYSQEDVKYGCDPRVEGTTGTIQCIWDVNETCVVKLDTPLIYDNNRVVSEYWDFTYNMGKITDEPNPTVNYQLLWGQLKNYLNTKHKDYSMQNATNENITNSYKLHELEEIIEHITQIENTN